MKKSIRAYEAKARKAAAERVVGLVPVTEQDLAKLAAGSTRVRVNLLTIWDGKEFKTEAYEGRFIRAREHHPGRAEDAVEAGRLQDMLYGGCCFLPILDSSREITRVFSPEGAVRSPLKPNLLQLYHAKEGEDYFLDRPVQRFVKPLDKKGKPN